MGISSESKEFAPFGANSFFKSRSHFRRAAYKRREQKQFHLVTQGENMEVCPYTLTHCILMDFSTALCWTSLFVILAVSGLFCR